MATKRAVKKEILTATNVVSPVRAAPRKRGTTPTNFSETRMVQIEQTENGKTFTQALTLQQGGVQANLYFADLLIDGRSMNPALITATSDMPRPFSSITLKLKKA